MEGSRIRELSPNHFRFGSGISAFTAKLKEQDAVGSEFLTSFHSLLPPQPQHTTAAAVHTAMGLFSHHPSHGKAPFSIDALLGLTTDTVRDNGSGHTHGPLLLNFRTHQKPFPDEGSKSKLSVRYAPYKRERKPHQHQQQQQEESKDVHSGRSGKAKRVRTIFTPEQLEKLESEFERQQYMVGTERSYLAESLDLTEAQVKVWFQNRRIKWRKVHLEMQQERLRALRSQEGPEFESSSDSSPSMDPCHRPTPSDPPSSDDRRGGSLGGATLSLPQPTLPNRWDASTNFHMDAYLLKTLGSRGDWTSGGHLTSEESGTESD